MQRRDKKHWSGPINIIRRKERSGANERIERKGCRLYGLSHRNKNKKLKGVEK
jgi:hypothetical protein